MTLNLMKGLSLAAALVLGGLTAPAQAMPMAGQLGCTLCPGVDGSENLVQPVARGSGRSGRMGGGSMYRPGRMGGGSMYRSRGSYGRSGYYRSRGTYGRSVHYRSRGSYGRSAYYRGRGHVRHDRRWDRRGRYGNRHHGHRHRFRYGGYGFGYYGYYDPFYYGYGYDPYGYGYGYDDGYGYDGYADAEVDDYAGGSDYVRYCRRKHPSFNSRTGRYRTHSGRYKKCVYRG